MWVQLSHVWLRCSPLQESVPETGTVNAVDFPPAGTSDCMVSQNLPAKYQKPVAKLFSLLLASCESLRTRSSGAGGESLFMKLILDSTRYAFGNTPLRKYVISWGELDHQQLLLGSTRNSWLMHLRHRWLRICSLLSWNILR